MVFVDEYHAEIQAECHSLPVLCSGHYVNKEEHFATVKKWEVGWVLHFRNRDKKTGLRENEKLYQHVPDFAGF